MSKVTLVRAFAYLCICAFVYLSIGTVPAYAEGITMRGTVYDAERHRPIAGAFVYHGDNFVQTDGAGNYVWENLPADAELMFKASAYAKQSVAVNGQTTLDVVLTPFLVKGVYISFGLLAVPDRVIGILDMIERTELNAVVVDMKGDRGWIGYDSAVPLTDEIDTERIKGRMIVEEFLAECEKRDIYAIARIVVFKDNPLAEARPDLATRRENGVIWLDREKLGWGNPFCQEVHDYNIGLAKEIARMGFDEIQFDYIRFPSDGDIKNTIYHDVSEEARNDPDREPWPSCTPAISFTDGFTVTAETRTRTLRTFMQNLRAALLPTGIFMSADTFGLTVWTLSDMGIGQRLVDIAPYMDYICPMVYPSTFAPTSMGFPNPAEYPYDVVARSYQIGMAQTRTKIRPWLQHYSIYGVEYDLDKLKAQKRAAADVGAYGWCYWNAGGKYNEYAFDLLPGETRPELVLER